MRLAASILLALSALTAAPMALAQDAPTVSVTGGTIAGTPAPGSTDLLFRAVPFAAPPTGPLRWMAPQPVLPWSGVRAADKRAPACLQNDYDWNHTDYLSGSEDCLTLDVRTPGMTGKRPVMVWIHGGSNRAGSAGDTVLSSITDKGVVLVALQYRLGIFGFLSPRGAAAEAGGHAGNYGLMDQIAALKWVQQNIAKFGGDPSNVTIFGESAGSQDVSLMLAAPAARGLFQKAIMESGTPGFGMKFRPIGDALKIGDEADKLLDAGGDIARLRATSVNALLAVDRKLTGPAPFGNDFVWLQTTIDGAVLPRDPAALIAEGPRRPVIIGTNRTEFGPDAGSTDTGAYIDTLFGDNAAKARVYYGIGGTRAPVDPRLGHLELEIETDIVFRCPAGRLADLVANTGTPVWRYEFDVTGDDTLTRHSAELAWVFGDKRFTSGATRLSLQDYWTNFAKTGVPDTGLPRWPVYEGKQQRHVLFNNMGVRPAARLMQPVCSLVEDF